MPSATVHTNMIQVPEHDHGVCRAEGAGRFGDRAQQLQSIVNLKPQNRYLNERDAEPTPLVCEHARRSDGNSQHQKVHDTGARVIHRSICTSPDEIAGTDYINLRRKKPDSVVQNAISVFVRWFSRGRCPGKFARAISGAEAPDLAQTRPQPLVWQPGTVASGSDWPLPPFGRHAARQTRAIL